jgi:hypothetical protein
MLIGKKQRKIGFGLLVVLLQNGIATVMQSTRNRDQRYKNNFSYFFAKNGNKF